MDWQPGTSAHWLAKISNVRVEIGAASVTVPALEFPIPAGFDAGNPAGTGAALGISVADLETILRLLLMQASLSWGGMAGFVLSGLLGVHGNLNGLPADWPVLTDPGAVGSLISDPFSALRN